MRTILALTLTLTLVPALALAQEEGEPAPTLPAPTLPAPTLPAPTLPDEPEPAPPEPEPEERAGPDPEVLFRITRDEDDEEIEGDVGFETPGDLRTDSATQGRVPDFLRGTPPPRERREAGDEEEDDLPPVEWHPPPFLVAAGAGWTRLLAVEALDFARIEQRFEAAIPDFEAVKLGVGVAELVGDQGRFLFEAGVRVGLGFYFCEASWIRCEGQITLQPGVIAGNPLGVQFDLHAGLDLRFLFEDVLSVSLGAAYSLVGTTSLIHTAGMLGLAF